MKKKILHLGAGGLMIANIKSLKEAGFEVYVLDKNPDAPGFHYSDKFAAIDIVDKNEVLDYALEQKIDAVLAVNDAGVNTAAFVCEKMGLIFHSLEVAINCTDKGYMRDCWRTKGLSQPDYIIINGSSEIYEKVINFGFPCVLKPCLNWGSKGVSIVKDKKDLNKAIDFVEKNDRNDRFIIERFINGTEVTVEGLVQNGSVGILACSDKEHQDHSMFRIAMALNYPARLTQIQENILRDLIVKAVGALGIVNGAFHAECLISDEDVFLVEMGGRPGGGHIFGYIVEVVSGINMPINLAKILLGLNAEIYPKCQKGSCYKFFSPPPGVFRAVFNLEEARKSVGILDLGFNMKQGSIVGPISNDADRPGYIVASGEDRNAAIANANNAFQKIKFRMDDN